MQIHLLIFVKVGFVYLCVSMRYFRGDMRKLSTPFQTPPNRRLGISSIQHVQLVTLPHYSIEEILTTGKLLLISPCIFKNIWEQEKSNGGELDHQVHIACGHKLTWRAPVFCFRCNSTGGENGGPLLTSIDIQCQTK